MGGGERKYVCLSRALLKENTIEPVDLVRFQEDFGALRVTHSTWSHQGSTVQVTVRGGQALKKEQKKIAPRCFTEPQLMDSFGRIGGCTVCALNQNYFHSHITWACRRFACCCQLNLCVCAQVRCTLDRCFQKSSSTWFLETSIFPAYKLCFRVVFLIVFSDFGFLIPDFATVIRCLYTGQDHTYGRVPLWCTQAPSGWRYHILIKSFHGDTGKLDTLRNQL